MLSQNIINKFAQKFQNLIQNSKPDDESVNFALKRGLYDFNNYQPQQKHIQDPEKQDQGQKINHEEDLNSEQQKKNISASSFPDEDKKIQQKIEIQQNMNPDGYFGDSQAPQNYMSQEYDYFGQKKREIQKVRSNYFKQEGEKKGESYEQLGIDQQNSLARMKKQVKKMAKQGRYFEDEEDSESGQNKQNEYSLKNIQRNKPHTYRQRKQVNNQDEEQDREAEYLYRKYAKDEKDAPSNQVSYRVNSALPDKTVPQSYLQRIHGHNSNGIIRNGNNIVDQDGIPIPCSPNGLTDGRQYNEAFRRSFTAKLLSSTQKMKKQSIKDVIRKASHKIQVHAYEIQAWLAAYQIIFIIQFQQQDKGKQFSQSVILRRISQLFLSYFKQNRTQKRYRLVKILGYVFRNFGFAQCKVSSYLNKIVHDNHRALDGVQFPQYGLDSMINLRASFETKPQINSHQNSIMAPEMTTKILNQVLSSDRGSDLSYNQFIKSNTIKQKRAKKESAKSENSIGINFKKNIAQKIDESLKIAFLNIMKQKGDELCLPTNVIRQIHEEHGSISISLETQKDEKQIKHENNLMKSFEPMIKSHSSAPQQNINYSLQNLKNDQILLNKLESKLAYFVKGNQNCHVSVLQRQTDSTMEQLGFSIKLKNEVRNKWFAYFLRKYKIKIPQKAPNVPQAKQPLIINQNKHRPPPPAPYHLSFKQRNKWKSMI